MRDHASVGWLGALDLDLLGTVFNREVCLRITLFRMGYITICLDGKM